MEETISLAEIFSILKKRFLLIVLAALFMTAAAGVATFFLITPKYSSSAELIVQSKKETDSMNLQSDVNANVLLINTYKDMIMGDVVLKPVQEKLASEYNYNTSISHLKDILTVEQSQNSQMFQIKATTDHPDNAMRIANVTANVFRKKASLVLDVNKVTITSKAAANMHPVSPNNQLNILIGAVVGLMLGVGLAFLLELLDKTVKDERFIAEELGLPILGAVDEMSNKEIKRGTNIEGRLALNHSQFTATIDEPTRRARPRV